MMNTAPIDENYIKEVFSWNLRKRMRDKKFTQTALAKKLGCSQALISMWANGKACPEFRSIAALCNTLECTPDYLMKDRYLDRFIDRYVI